MFDFSKVIREQGLDGRSFVMGVALSWIMKNGLNEQEQDDLDERFDCMFGEQFDACEQVGLKLRYNYRALAEVLDLSVLDEIARELDDIYWQRNTDYMGGENERD